MPKLKTHKGTSKRVRVTKTGKVQRERAFGNHLLSKKSKSRKRTIKSSATIEGKSATNVKKVLGVN